jgi:hypothetical protein
MTAAAVLFQERLERVRTAALSDTAAITVLALLTTVLAAITWGTWGDLDSDTGYEVVAAARMVDGELPYRDFVYYYGPLAPALAGLVSLVASTGLWSAVGLGFAITLAILAATYAVARIVVDPLGAALATTIAAAVAFIPDNYSYVLPHTHSATLGTLLLLALLLAIWRSASNATSAGLVAVGGCVGLLLLTKPEPAVAGVFAVSVWLAARSRSGASVRRPLALVAAPALAIPALVYGGLLTFVSPDRLVLDNLYPVDVLEAGGNVELRGRVPLTLSSFVELGGKLALYAAGAAMLLLAAYCMRRGGLARRVALGAAGLGGLGAVGAALANPEALRHGLEFVYGWIPAGAALALGVCLWRRRGSRDAGSPAAQVELAGLAALTAVAATTYPGFFPHAPHEQMAAYYIPLAAIFLARLHLRELAPTRQAYVVGALWVGFVAVAGLGLTLKDARADSVVVHGAAGALAEQPREAALMQGALDWIERETKPGEQIFVAPMMTGLYALSGRTSPVAELSMLPDALPSAADEQRAIAALESAEVRLVITDDRTWPGYGHTQFGDSFDRGLARWLATSFERAGSLRAGAGTTFEGHQAPRTLTIWKRRKS